MARSYKATQQDAVAFVEELTAHLGGEAQAEARKTMLAIFYGKQEAGVIPAHPKLKQKLSEAKPVEHSRRRGRG